MIYDPTFRSEPQLFDVRIGHTRVQVESRSPEEAIQVARRQLCVEMPRMWDVISTMPELRFEVQPVEG